MTIDIVIAAILGWFANYLMHQLTTRMEEFSRRVDELCEQISRLADLSTEYWLHSAPDSARLLEAKILGKQHWVQSAIGMLTEDIWYFSWSIEDDLLDFMDSLTGGNFGSNVRTPDFSRSVLVQSSASNLVFSIRRKRRSIRSF